MAVTQEQLVEFTEHDWSVDWNADRVVELYRVLEGSMVEHLPELMQAALDAGWNPAYLPAILAPLFGDVSAEQHAFSAQGLDWGVRLTEPQITAALVHFLSPTVFIESGPQRCASFVRALYRAAGLEDDRQRPDPSLATPGTLKVEAERRIGSRRIDIALEWYEGPITNKASRRLVLIECKFGHQVTSKQLPAYREYAKRWTDDGRYELFLLLDRFTSRTTTSISRNQEWQPVTWLAVLRCLEQELAQEPVEGEAAFACLRRTIWDMANSRAF